MKYDHVEDCFVVPLYRFKERFDKESYLAYHTTNVNDWFKTLKTEYNCEVDYSSIETKLNTIVHEENIIMIYNTTFCIRELGANSFI